MKLKKAKELAQGLGGWKGSRLLKGQCQTTKEQVDQPAEAKQPVRHIGESGTLASPQGRIAPGELLHGPHKDGRTGCEGLQRLEAVRPGRP